MTKIQTFYCNNEDLLEEVNKIKWREKKSFSEINTLALEEYVKHHKEGNEQYTLDSPVIATPAFFRDYKTIEKYFEKLTNKEEDEFKFKLQEWNGAFKKRFGHYP